MGLRQEVMGLPTVLADGLDAVVEHVGEFGF
jgi:hypothetical protein